MSLDTQALVPAVPKKAGKPADGRTGAKGQEAPEDAASRFQAMMNDARTGETGQKGARSKAGGAEPATDENSTSGGQTDGGEAALPDGEGAGTQPQFSTKTLTDALRQASQNVLSSKAPHGGQDQGGAAEEQAPNAPSVSPFSMASSALALNSVLQAPSGRNAVLPGAVQAGQPTVLPQTGQPDKSVAGEGQAGEGGRKTGTSSLFAQFGVEPEKVSEKGAGAGSNGPALPDEAAGTVKVLRQETHFAPNMRLSPAQQVGDQVAGFLKDAAAQMSRAPDGLTAKAEGPVLKTLDIQLTPHELGSVKVSLRMVGDNVEVSLMASKAHTAELLKHDRQLLDQMLRATGFKADTITIQTADDRITVQQSGAANSGNSATGQNGSGNGAAANGQPQNFGGNNPDQQNGERRDTAFNASEALKGKGHEEDARISLSDGIYL